MTCIFNCCAKLINYAITMKKVFKRYRFIHGNDRRILQDIYISFAVKHKKKADILIKSATKT